MIRWHIMRWLYSLFFTCMLPWIFFRLWLRSFKLPAYRKRWSERLGLVPLPPLDDVLWLHAVSVGEAVSAFPLIHRIHAQYPKIPILITTTTPTGSERVQAAFRDKLGKNIYHCYLPYDLPWILNRFFKRVKARMLILMETELWPNLLYQCQQKNVPVLIANARLSPKSISRYQLLGGVMPSMMRAISLVAAQSHLDMKRFESLGVARDSIVETGNIKFDSQLPSYIQEAGRVLRNEIGETRLVWIAASTHEGEEASMLEVYTGLKKSIPELLLLLVPRHPERFNKVAQLCQDRGLEVVRRSQKMPCKATTDVFLGDTMGELFLFYAASNIAFVGGSFAPIGGHNLLEPAALGLPVLTGPHLSNFVAISEMLLEAKGLRIVENERMLQETILQFYENKELGLSLGRHAKKVVEDNRGALDKLMELIASLFEFKKPDVTLRA